MPNSSYTTANNTMASGGSGPSGVGLIGSASLPQYVISNTTNNSWSNNNSWNNWSNNNSWNWNNSSRNNNSNHSWNWNNNNSNWNNNNSWKNWSKNNGSWNNWANNNSLNWSNNSESKNFLLHRFSSISPAQDRFPASFLIPG